MPQLIWSPAALRDVERLYKFLAEKNPDAARRAARAIREGMQILRDHPAAGRPMGTWIQSFVSGSSPLAAAVTLPFTGWKPTVPSFSRCDIKGKLGTNPAFTPAYRQPIQK